MRILLNAIEISLALSPVILLLLLVSPLLGKHYGARLRCFMWLALAVRLLIPFNTPLVNAIPIQPLPTFGTELMAQADIVPEREDAGFIENTREPAAGDAATVSPKAPASIHLAPALILPAIWGLGAGLFLLYHLLAYILTYRKLWRWSTSVTDPHLLRRFARIKNELSIKRSVRLRRSAKAASPLLIGFLRPCIILPHAPLDSEQLDFILYHELTHLKRGDLWFKLAALLANAVHWFNPLVWLITSRVGFDTELACDADVLAGTERDVRKAYGYTVLAFIEQGWRCRTPLTSRFLGGKKQMKQRFRNITDMSVKRRGFAAMFAIVLIIALAGSTVYAADGAAQKVSYPDFKYTVAHFTKYDSDLPGSDMLSMDKAAEKCAQYIYDMYGENGDGNTLWMRYMNGNNSWGCLVAKTGSEPERDNFLFSVFIDAGNGQRNNILDMRDTDSNLPKKSITDFEVAERNKKAPADLEKYEKLALEVARKHFYDSKVVSVNYHSMGIASSSGGAVTFVSYSGRVYEYKETLLSFVATDTKGRESEITIVMETGKLREIYDYVSDEEIEAQRAETAEWRAAERARMEQIEPDQE